MPRFDTSVPRIVLVLAAIAVPAAARQPAPVAPVDPVASAAAGSPPAGAPAVREPDRHPDLVRLSPTEEVWVDRARKEVVVGGKIALAEGAIEVFACPAGTKEHEAVVAIKASARLVHAALLAIGLDPGRPATFQPVYRAAEGPAVSIRMRWVDADGKHHECPAQQWIRRCDTGAALDADWVFTGSEFWRDPADGREYYQADGGDFVCVSNFPTATLDLPIESSQSNDALMFEATAGDVPPHGTAVEMVLAAKR